MNYTAVRELHLHPSNFVTLTRVTNDAPCNWVKLMVQVSLDQFVRCEPPLILYSGWQHVRKGLDRLRFSEVAGRLSSDEVVKLFEVC